MENETLISDKKTQKLLAKAGFGTIFDIASISQLDFVNSVKELGNEQARHIHGQARQRARNLRSLFRAVQLRQEPVINALSKLNAGSDLEPLQECLVRSLGGGGDFSDLMTRSSEYADVTSIQSLFSPGRYATALYKVARDLYPKESPLHIDNRRPDLQNLQLSETTMTQEVSSLDVLLGVLDTSGEGLPSLSDTYFPMTLPYDDSQGQINAALSAQDSTLIDVWDILTDKTLRAVKRAGVFQPQRNLQKSDYLSGEVFYLKTSKMIYFAHYTQDGSVKGAQLTQGKNDNAAENIVAPLLLTWASKDQCYYLGVPDGTTMAGSGDKELTGCFLHGNSNTNPSNPGPYAQMASKNGSLQPVSGFHTSVKLLPAEGSTYFLKTDAGYVGPRSSGQSNWEEALSIDATIEEALQFLLCKDEKGTPIDNGSSVYPEVINTQPSPPAREMLSLTPACYQLITNPEPTEEDIIAHYGIDKTISRDGTLADLLNDIPTFLSKTQLTFNLLLDMTAQLSYTPGSVEEAAAGKYLRFGGTGSHTHVNVYGANYLNAGLSDSGENGEDFLRVQNDGESLNFTSDSVVDLAGRAEKLVRLARLNRLTFEELDWLIVNSSHCVSDHANKAILDTSTMNVIAECMRLRKRYGTNVNEFIALISAINPYAKSQEKSLYESAFTSITTNRAIPFGEKVNYLTGEGEYVTHCCEALGVTGDEFSRIGTYCFGGSGEFTMDEFTASRIYRFSAIPRMLGMTFAQAEALWVLMGDGKETLLHEIGRDHSLLALDIIRQTESILEWMADNQLSVLNLQGMLTTQWSGTATAEMFNVLKNVYESVNDTSAERETLTQAQRQKILRALSAPFKLKSNVMAAVINWLESTSVESEPPFTLSAYWNNINALFSQENPTLESLQSNEALVIDTQQLSQRVLITQWLTLTEQDIQLCIQYPQWLQENTPVPQTPDLLLLLTLSRFKRWQTQVTVSRDEALRCFEQLNSDTQSMKGAAELIGLLHDVDSGMVEQLNTFLFGEKNWPRDFTALWKLLTWVKTGKLLNIGSHALNGLQNMMFSEPESEEPELLAYVARSLSAGLHAPIR